MGLNLILLSLFVGCSFVAVTGRMLSYIYWYNRIESDLKKQQQMLLNNFGYICPEVVVRKKWSLVMFGNSLYSSFSTSAGIKLQTNKIDPFWLFMPFIWKQVCHLCVWICGIFVSSFCCVLGQSNRECYACGYTKKWRTSGVSPWSISKINVKFLQFLNIHFFSEYTIFNSESYKPKYFWMRKTSH